ncbi:MAG: imidazolonepropionase [Vicingaceae bacterium]
MIIIKNIKKIVQVLPKEVEFLRGQAMNELKCIENGWITVKNGYIDGFGKMEDFKMDNGNYDIIDASGKLVLPLWCDSHTHTVFAATREQEFVDRINGLTYEEIANRGGGILNSASKLKDKDEEVLYDDALKRINEAISYGTGAMEIKSGYGLSLESEMKMLRVIKRLKETAPIPIKATFLGAHAIPLEYKKKPDDYVDLIINKMLPLIAKENLADYIDVFCETNYFTPEQTDKILAAGLNYGLKPKVHVNQFTAIGGVAVSVKNKALSVDHLEEMTPEDFDVLANSETFATLLPSCSFFLSIPYAPAKKMIEKNIKIALATDFNPGSTPSFNMNFVVALACIKMGLTPEQAINAATINGAAAMEVADKVGSITIGKKANFMITKPMNNYTFIPYSFGSNPVDVVFLEGKIYNS